MENAACVLPVRSKVLSAPMFKSRKDEKEDVSSYSITLRAGVHAPTKSVSVPAAISVVLIFHVSLWPGSTRGRHDKVIGTTTDMSA